MYPIEKIESISLEDDTLLIAHECEDGWCNTMIYAEDGKLSIRQDTSDYRKWCEYVFPANDTLGDISISADEDGIEFSLEARIGIRGKKGES